MSNKELILPILKDGKYGFIDSDFNMAIKPKYNYVSSRFKEGYCIITYIKKIRNNTKWIFVSRRNPDSGHKTGRSSGFTSQFPTSRRCLHGYITPRRAAGAADDGIRRI